MPLSRPLGDGVFELRFTAEGVARRITHWFADWQPGLIVCSPRFASSARSSGGRSFVPASPATAVESATGRHAMTERSTWREIKGKQAQRDPRSGRERDADRAAVSLRFDVAQFVYDLRASAGLTQRQLADRMGTTQSVISRLEQAGRLPTLEMLGRIAAATGADVRLQARHAGGADADVPINAA